MTERHPKLIVLALLLVGILLESALPRLTYHWILELFGPSTPAVSDTGGTGSQAGLKGSETDEPPILALLQKFGEALIVAAVLAAVVDGPVKKALVTEVSRDVLDFAVGFELPEKVKEQVKYILRLPFVRTDFSIRFELAIVPGLYDPATRRSTDYVCVKSETEYKVSNLTENEQIYEFKSSTERYHAPTAPENELVKMEVPSLAILKQGSDLEALTKNDGFYKKAILQVPIPSRGKGPVLVKTVRRQYFPPEYPFTLDILEPPCIGLQIAVKHPSNMTVKIAFGVPGVASYDVKDGVEVWSHPGVHLPGSHFRVSWSREKTKHDLANESKG